MINLYRPTLTNFICAALGTSQITRAALVEKVVHNFPEYSRISITRALTRAINISRITVLPNTSLGSPFIRLNVEEPENYPILASLAQPIESFAAFADATNPGRLFVVLTFEDSLTVFMLNQTDSESLSDLLSATTIASFGESLQD